MLLAWTLTFLVALALSTLLLLALGRHLYVSSRLLGIIVVGGLVAAAGQLSARIWQLPSSDVIGAEMLLAACGLIVVLARPRWNPAGQVFFGSFLGAAIAYLAFAASLTFDVGLSAFGVAASQNGPRSYGSKRSTAASDRASWSRIQGARPKVSRCRASLREYGRYPHLFA